MDQNGCECYFFWWWGYLIGFKICGRTNWGNLPNTPFFSELLRSVQTSFCLLFNSSSSSITIPWRKQSNLWIRWIQYATLRNNFTSPPKLAMSPAMQNFAPTPSYFTSGQHFLETFMLLPETTRTTNSRWLHRFCHKVAIRLLQHQWRTYLPHTFNNALT